MMKCLVVLAAVVAVATAVRVSFSRLSGSSSSEFYEGDNVTITCEDQPSTVGLFSGLSLVRIQRQEIDPGTTIFNYLGLSGIEPQETWYTGLTASEVRRYSVDQKALDVNNGARFRIIIMNLECNDGGMFWCLASGTASATGGSKSSTQNMTIIGAPSQMIIRDFTACQNDYSENPDEKLDCGLANCQAMARHGEVPSYTCVVSVSAENAYDYTIRWFKSRQDYPDMQAEELRENITVPTIRTTNSRTDCPKTEISSTIEYAPLSTDHSLVIECRLFDRQQSSFGDSGIMNYSVNVCVKGLTRDTNAGGDTAASGETDNAGMIAGIVIGVIALIVLVVLLVYFLWYRRRDEGETYNTKDDNAMSSDPDKPDHATTGYEGNNFRHNRPTGYVSRHVDDDDDIKKPPSYGKDNPALDDDDFDNDVEVKPRVTYHTGHQNPIGSAV